MAPAIVAAIAAAIAKAVPAISGAFMASTAMVTGGQIVSAGIGLAGTKRLTEAQVQTAEVGLQATKAIVGDDDHNGSGSESSSGPAIS